MSKLTSYFLRDICSFKRGDPIDIKDKHAENTYPIINNVNEIKYYTDKYNRNENTIIINLIGKSGCIQKYKSKIFLTKHFYSVHIKDLSVITEEYLYYYLKSIQEKIYSIRRNSLQTYICFYEIQNLCIHIPSIERQLKIIEEIQKNNVKIEKLNDDIKKLNELNKSLVSSNQ